MYIYTHIHTPPYTYIYSTHTHKIIYLTIQKCLYIACLRIIDNSFIGLLNLFGIDINKWIMQ